MLKRRSMLCALTAKELFAVCGSGNFETSAQGNVDYYGDKRVGSATASIGYTADNGIFAGGSATVNDCGGQSARVYVGKSFANGQGSFTGAVYTDNNGHKGAEIRISYKF